MDEIDSAPWRARYDDLAGKVAVVTGHHEALDAVVEALASNGMAVSVVAGTREGADRAVAAAEALGATVFGVEADPADPATWSRVVPHSEQRLGPLDVLVTLGPAAMRAAAIAAIAPDMAARRRGVVIEVASQGDTAAGPAGVRHRVITDAIGSEPGDIAAAVTLCASDVLKVQFAAMHLGTGA